MAERFFWERDLLREKKFAFQKFYLFSLNIQAHAVDENWMT